ncbi:MAG: hypothetical protein QM640_07165 [Niabella sp.]
MKTAILVCLFSTGFIHADAQILSKIKTQVDHTVSLAKTTAANKVDERTTQAASQKTDKLMDKALSAKISFKKKKKQAGEPATDSATTAPVAIDTTALREN